MSLRKKGLKDDFTMMARQCSGVITGIDTTQSCFIKISIREADHAADLDVQYCCGAKFSSFFTFIEVGDIITKVKGEMTVKVSKLKQQQTKEFGYPFCLQ